jgi:Flp pilus assembly protein TadD
MIVAAAVALVCAIPVVIWWSRAPVDTVTVPASRATAAVAPPRIATGPPPPVIEDAARLPAAPPFRPSPRLPADSQSTDAASALTAHRDTLERAPQDAAALYGVGVALLALGRAQEALTPLQESMQLRPGDWASAFTYGRALAAVEDFPGAVSAFRNAKTLAPDDAIASANLALALLRMGDRTAAAREFTSAIALDPGDPPSRLGLAISLDAAGQATDAAAAYREYLRMTSPGPEADRINARLSFLTGDGGSS